jgi:hypothetical protein
MIGLRVSLLMLGRTARGSAAQWRAGPRMPMPVPVPVPVPVKVMNLGLVR